MKALAREPRDRYPTARAMAIALEACGPAATASEVGEWVEVLANESLSRRALLISTLEGLGDPMARVGSITDETLTIPIPLPFLPLPEEDEPPCSSPMRRQLDTIPLGAITVVEKAPVSAPERKIAIEAEAAPIEKADLGPVEKTEITASRAMASPHEKAPQRRPALAFVALAALSLILFVAIWTRPRAPTTTAQEAASPLASASATASAEPIADPVPTASAREIDLEAPTAAVAPPPPPSAARPSKTTPRATARPVDGNPCSPPYFLDAQGHKHYKRECL
jgi:serine/threonine-protein kinase